MSEALSIGVRIGLRPKAVMRADKGDEYIWLALEGRDEYDQPIILFPPKGASYEDLVEVAGAFNKMIAKANAAKEEA